MADQISKPLRVLIADDHPITGRGLADLIGSVPDFELAALVTDGKQALEACAATHPELLLLDLALPVLSGLLVAERLMRLADRPRIVVISGVGIASQFAEAQRLGIEGLLSKEDEPATIILAMRTVREGRPYVSSNVQKLLNPLVGGTDPYTADHAGTLTKREREVLCLIAEGLSTNSISEQLSIAPNTVKKHRENIRGKLGIGNAADAARAAARMGLIKF